MIDSRSKILLKAIVEKYISDAEPIGSRSLSKISGLELSPASIRNIMADLEESGYITSIHTSSGRIPSNKGYRLFVDSLIQIRNLNNDQKSIGIPSGFKNKKDRGFENIKTYLSIKQI